MYPKQEAGIDLEFASGAPQAPQPQQAKDREVTLGPILLGGLGAGLLVLCCLCFLAGYEVGNHGAPLPGLKGAAVDNKGPSAAEILAQVKPATTPATPASKPVPPPATAAKAVTPATNNPALPTAAPLPAYALHTAGQTTPASATPASAAAPALQTASATPVVRPALAVTAPMVGAWHVQIAAVEHSDDADVLLSALRKRGYAVSVHHDPGDNLLHVQVGPFPSQGDAEAARQKLLSDGYNAILQH